MPRRPVRANAAALVFALLILATVAAFGWAQRLKRDPLVLDRVTTSVVAAPGHPCQVRIRFRVTRSDKANVQVTKPGGRVVYTLAADRFLKRYHYFVFHWNGRRQGGGFAKPGRYKLRVELLGQERSLVPPGGTIHLRRAVELGTKRCRQAVPQAPKGPSS